MASLNLKRTIAAGAAAVFLGGVTIGLVNAQPTPTPNTSPGGGQRHGITREGMQQRHEQYLDTLAGKLGVTVDKLRQAISETHNELGGPKGPGGQRRGLRGGGFDLDAAAQAMTITRDQLRTELAGKTLTAVAAAHNVPATTVANALKTAATTRIDQAVAANRITADQANRAKQSLDQRINQLMNRTFPAAGEERGPRQRRGESHERGAQQQGAQLSPLGSL
jgi:hypothetical protein